MSADPVLLYNLRRLGSQVYDRFEHINHGGCCAYAALVGTRLKDMGIPFKGEGSAGWYPESPAHVFLQLWPDDTPWFHDAAFTKPWIDIGDFEPTTGNRISGPIEDTGTVEALVDLYNNTRWNPFFDAREGIPFIKRMITRHLGPPSEGWPWLKIE